LVAQSESRWVWQVEFKKVCDLFRSVLEVRRNSSGAYHFHVFLDGDVTSPSWTATSPGHISTGELILRLDSNEPGKGDSTRCAWPSEVSLTAFPSASREQLTPYYISPDPSHNEMSLFAGAGGSGSCDGCDIVLTGYTNNKCLIGQFVTAKVECDPGVKVTNIQWTLSPGTIESFEATDGPPLWKGIRTLLPPDQLQVFKVFFYWVSSGTKTIKVTFKRNGASCTLAKTVTVVEPTVVAVDPRDSFGTVQAEPGNESTAVQLGKITETGTEPGILFEASIETPSEFVTGAGSASQGVWQFTQTTQGTLWRKSRADGTCTRIITEPIDAALPEFIDDSFVYAGPWEADGATNTTEDSPGFRNTPVADYSSFDYDTTYKMYIMYKPPGDESVFVPVKRCSWAVKFCAAGFLGTNEWVVIQSDGTEANNWVSTSIFPQWNRQFPTNSIVNPNLAACLKECD